MAKRTPSLGPKVDRRTVARPSSSFPPQYLKLFMYVLRTGKSVTINTLGTERGAYTTLASRINMWRRALLEEGAPIADMLYGVVCDKEEYSPGKWHAVIRLRDQHHADALDKLLPEDDNSVEAFVVAQRKEQQERDQDRDAAQKQAEEAGFESEPPLYTSDSAAEQAIRSLYSDDDDEADPAFSSDAGEENPQ